MPRYPTMTLHECADAFRLNHVPISESALMDAISAGRFPFAVYLSGPETSPPGTPTHRKALIFREKFYAWLSEMLCAEAYDPDRPDAS